MPAPVPRVTFVAAPTALTVRSPVRAVVPRVVLLVFARTAEAPESCTTPEASRAFAPERSMWPRAAATCVIEAVAELRTEPTACVMLPAAARRVMLRLEVMLPTVRFPAVALRVTEPARVALPAIRKPALVLTVLPVRLMPPPPEDALPCVDRVAPVSYTHLTLPTKRIV